MKSLAIILFFVSISLWGSAAAAQEYFAFWPLQGSSQSLEKQNKIADDHNLSRIENDAMLRDFIAKKLLIRVPAETSTFYVSTEKKFQYLRPWAKEFLEEIAARHFARFGIRLKISSLVRTRVYQDKLVREKISDADGKIWERQSTHLTGSAFDISRITMSPGELSWMRGELLSWKKRGLIEPEEEFINNTFHVMVSPVFSTEIRAEKKLVPKPQKPKKKSR